MKKTKPLNKLALEVRSLLKVVQITSDIIIVCDSTEQIVYVNPAFEKLSGYSELKLGTLFKIVIPQGKKLPKARKKNRA